MTNSLKDFFEGKVSEFKPQGSFDSSAVYTMEDYRDLVETTAQAKQNGINLDAELHSEDFFTEEGVIATPRSKYVINENIAFANKVRINDDNTIDIVVDYRAISEQETGQVYAPFILSYKISKVGKNLTVKSKGNISANEFINDFTESLEPEDAQKIYEVITRAQNNKNKGISLDELFKSKK